MRSAFIALALTPALVLGSSLVPRALADRAKAADRVVVVQVLSSRVEVEGGNARRMFTHTDVVVGETLKGPVGSGLERITITQLGGKWGLWEAHVPGDATFSVGETALVLLRCSPTPNQCGLYGLAEGKVNLIGDDAYVFDLKTSSHTRRAVGDVLRELRAALGTSAVGPGAGVTR